MATKFWLDKGDKGYFGNVCRANTFIYSKGILTGEITDDGRDLQKIRRKFVAGEVKIWKYDDKDIEQKHLFVKINNHHMYPEGIMMTPFSDFDVQYHLKAKPIEGHHRVELFGSDHDNFIGRVFWTYQKSPDIGKRCKKDMRFFIYLQPKNIAAMSLI